MEKKDKRLNPDGDDRHLPPPDEVDGRYAPGYTNAIPGINTPGMPLPAFNPPVPNRAWTAMREGRDIDALTEEEKRELYVGRDNLF